MKKSRDLYKLDIEHNIFKTVWNMESRELYSLSHHTKGVKKWLLPCLALCIMRTLTWCLVLGASHCLGARKLCASIISNFIVGMVMVASGSSWANLPRFFLYHIAPMGAKDKISSSLPSSSWTTWQYCLSISWLSLMYMCWQVGTVVETWQGSARETVQRLKHRTLAPKQVCKYG